MKYFLLIPVVLILVAGCENGQQSETPDLAENNTRAATDQPPAMDMAEETARAKEAVQVFAGALKAELQKAMQAGGPVAAIGLCNTRAMPITQQVASEHGLQLGRVSLKYRNPGNAPNEWQNTVLEEFERRKASGEDPAGMAWSEIVNTGGRQEFRFMKAIPTGDVCLICHGTGIAPEVSEVLASLYPEDLATGFEVGDIRGAFVVTR